MEKIKLLYVVSTLVRCGPTNQLLNIIRNLDPGVFQPTVITLSPEPSDSLKYKYDELGIDVQSLDISRVQGLFKSKELLRQRIKKIAPSVIHTQGIRADSLLSKLKLQTPWVMTSRNYPFDDYPMKFGALKGKLMAYSHIAAMRRCNNVVACSKTIASVLTKHNIVATPIQNGVHNEPVSSVADSGELPRYEAPVFISVGSLIARKNMELLIEAFNRYSKDHKGSLLILGGGPEQSALEEQVESERIHILGSVSNVRDYLLVSDYFLSASLSEGLPNTVLEGLASGLPALLSNIPSHEEIESESSKCSNIFALEKGADELLEKMILVNRIFDENASDAALKLAQTVLSAEAMSNKYQALYQSLLK
ncbi:glycosyltransferase [Vibrio sp. 10N.286.48.B8]|uniref:glycosyltransferase n=1 Tax=Vibrio sp. 10N.286.48.B8 TaxID=2056189 RepID=UPI0021592EC0|nr:glycosyltransferase [Vibrio sp. 10N.286.48.B8]